MNQIRSFFFRTPTRRRVTLVAGAVAILEIVWGTTLSLGINGVVRVPGTLAPVGDVIVAEVWYGRPTTWIPGPWSLNLGHPPPLECYHVDSVTTKRDGSFRMPRWIQYRPPGFAYSREYQWYYAYKKGFDIDSSDRFTPYVLNARPFTGTAQERWRTLTMLINVSCSSRATDQPLIALRTAAYNEAKELATTEQNKEWLEYLRIRERDVGTGYWDPIPAAQ